MNSSTDKPTSKEERLAQRFVRDVDGARFRVTKSFQCDLGIPIYRGVKPENSSSPSEYILTPVLAAMIREWSMVPGKLLAFMPFEAPTLIQLRKRLGIGWHDEKIMWWAQRFDELMSLAPKEFARRHDRSHGSVRTERSAIIRLRVILEEPEAHKETIALLKQDWSDRKSKIREKLGPRYSNIRSLRKAYQILRAVGEIKDAA